MLIPGAIPHDPIAFPTAIGYDAGVKFSMFGNDTLPDCTIAAIGNYLDLLWHHAGKSEVWDDGAVERMFDLVPPRDRTQGRKLLDVLTWWRDNGLPDNPLDKPIGWAPLRWAQLAEGIWRYGAVYTRVMLPMGQDDWDWSDNAVKRGIPGTGSHCVLAIGCDANIVRVASYGTRIKVSRAWWTTYAQDEAYGIMHPLWKEPR